jgi:hypothetical protein
LWTTQGNDALRAVQSSMICRPSSRRNQDGHTSTTSTPTITDDWCVEPSSSVSFLPTATSVLSELYGLSYSSIGSDRSMVTKNRTNDTGTVGQQRGDDHGRHLDGLTIKQIGDRVEKLVSSSNFPP